MISKKVQDKGEPINSGLFLQARYLPATDNSGDRRRNASNLMSVNFFILSK